MTYFETKQNHFQLRPFLINDGKDLIEIADAMNQREKEEAGYQAYYAFAVPADCVDYQKKLFEKVQCFLEKNEKEKRQIPRSTYRMAVCNFKNQLIGGVAIDMLPITGQNKQKIYGDLGYFISPDEGGKGIIPAVVKYVLSIYFKHFSRMDFTIHPDNVYSRRVAEKINAKPVGFIAQSGYENQPRVRYLLTKEDFLMPRCARRCQVMSRTIDTRQNQRD